MENCSSFKYLSVDTEGFAPNPLGISVAHPGLESMYFPVGHREDVNIDAEVKEALYCTISNVDYRIFHNAGHDITILPFLWNRPFICTMIMGHMVNENLMSKGLDYMAKHYLGIENGKQMDPLMESIIDTMGWDYVPFELMNKYAEIDAKITMRLFQKLLPLYEEQFGPLWSVE